MTTPSNLALLIATVGVVVFILRIILARRATVSPRGIQLASWIVLLQFGGVVVVLWSVFQFIQPGMGYVVLLLAAAWLAFWSIPSMKGMGYTTSILIRCTPEQAFAFISNPINWSRYTNVLMAYHLDMGPIRIGSRIGATVHTPGQALDAVEVVVEYDPPKVFSTQLKGATELLTGSTLITPAKDGVVVTVVFRTTGSLSAALLGQRISKRAQEAKLRTSKEEELLRLKEILEHGNVNSVAPSKSA